MGLETNPLAYLTSLSLKTPKTKHEISLTITTTQVSREIQQPCNHFLELMLKFCHIGFRHLLKIIKVLHIHINSVAFN